MLARLLVNRFHEGTELVGDQDAKVYGTRYFNELDLATAGQITCCFHGRGSAMEKLVPLLCDSEASLIIAHMSFSASVNRKKVKQKGQLILFTYQPKQDFNAIYLSQIVPVKFEEDHRSILPTTHLRTYGPNVNIDRNAKIGKNCCFDGNNLIHGNVTIGDNCVIGAGAVIGGQGFNHHRISRGVQQVPGTGGVKIGNHVHIGDNATITCGKFNDTVIGDYCRIDNLVHIAHDVTIGERTLVAANAMIAGHTSIGEDCWISPSASIVNRCSIGDRAIVGLGSVVMRPVQEDTTVFGVPAMPLPKLRLEGIKQVTEEPSK